MDLQLYFEERKGDEESNVENVTKVFYWLNKRNNIS